MWTVHNAAQAVWDFDPNPNTLWGFLAIHSSKSTTENMGSFLPEITFQVHFSFLFMFFLLNWFHQTDWPFPVTKTGPDYKKTSNLTS